VARLTLFFLLISISGFSQSVERKILFKGDSIWYAAENQSLYSSTTKGQTWDTIFAKRNQTDTVFFNGALDTATNVFIADQKTLFVFGWDGTMHYKTILYCSSDCGKTWNRSTVYAENGIIGVHYLHKISGNHFFLDCRHGNYMLTFDNGKTWVKKRVTEEKHTCNEGEFIFGDFGYIYYSYITGKNCRVSVNLISKDGGIIWQNPGNE
jgi:photosystem II stability/assembly factor-like uncharacterized protein